MLSTMTFSLEIFSFDCFAAEGTLEASYQG